MPGEKERPFAKGLLAPVSRLVWHDPAHAAPWVGHVVHVARNDVHMGMGHSLASGDPIINSDVKAGRRKGSCQFLAHGGNQVPERLCFRGRKTKDAVHMLTRHNQRVALAEWITIREGNGRSVCSDEFTTRTSLAKWAIGGPHRSRKKHVDYVNRWKVWISPSEDASSTLA